MSIPSEKVIEEQFKFLVTEFQFKLERCNKIQTRSLFGYNRPGLGFATFQPGGTQLITGSTREYIFQILGL